MAYKRIYRRKQQELVANEGATPEVNRVPDVAEIQTDRELMTVDDAMTLQDVVGNRAVGQLTGAATPPTLRRTGYVQPKPTPPNRDPHRGRGHLPAYAHIMRKLQLQRAAGDGSFETNDNFESQVKQQSGGGNRCQVRCAPIWSRSLGRILAGCGCIPMQRQRS